jgi:hypothetical protein
MLKTAFEKELNNNALLGSVLLNVYCLKNLIKSLTEPYIEE